jgi:hypothetical protein
MQETGGRAEVQVWGTLYGAFLGIAVPLLADADGPEAYGAGLLLGAPAGFLVSRAYARSRSMSEGQARAITWGGLWGTWQAFGWAQATDLGSTTREICFDPDDPNQCFDDTTTDDDKILAATIVGGLAGIGTGIVLSRKPIGAGLATTVQFGSLWGTWFGVAGGVLADLENDDLLMATLIGGDLTLVATALAAPGWNMTRPRARIISISGVLGALGGLGVALLASVDDENTAIGLPLAGSIAGLALGASLTRNGDGADDNGGADDGRNDGAATPAAGARFEHDSAMFSHDARGTHLSVPTLTPALIPTTGRDGTRRLAPGVVLTILRF